MKNGQTETSFGDQKSKQPEIKSQLMGRDKYVLAQHQHSIFAGTNHTNQESIMQRPKWY
jgi:hypothetical protein